MAFFMLFRRLFNLLSLNILTSRLDSLRNNRREHFPERENSGYSTTKFLKEVKRK